MKRLRHASLLYLLMLWAVFHASSEDKMSSSTCDIILTSVRTEVPPTVLHELCFDNYAVTFVVRCDKIWYERILDVCSNVGLHIWDVSMDGLSISSPLTLELVKFGKVIDSSKLNITTDHLVHTTISMLGGNKTRFVLAIERDCSIVPNNGTSVPGLHVPEVSSERIVLNQSASSVQKQLLSHSKLNHQEEEIFNTTTENFNGKRLLVNSNNNVHSLKPVQATQTAETVSTEGLKCVGDVHCSESLDLYFRNNKFSSDYPSQSAYVKEYSDTGGSNVRDKKIPSLKQSTVDGYFSSVFQDKTPEIESTSVRLLDDTQDVSHYVSHKYHILKTLTVTPTVYPDILHHRITSSRKYMLKSDVPMSHFEVSSIVLENVTQHSNGKSRKYNANKFQSPPKRIKRNSDKKLEALELLSSYQQSASFLDGLSSLSSQWLDATHTDGSLDTTKQRTHSSYVKFEANDAGNTPYSLVNVETSDSLLSIDSSQVNMLPNGEQHTLEVSATQTPLFTPLYSSDISLHHYTVSVDLPKSMLPEYTFHKEYEMPSAFITHNSVSSQLKDPPNLEKAATTEHMLDTIVLTPSVTLWTDKSEFGLDTTVHPYTQNEQASKIDPTKTDPTKADPTKVDPTPTKVDPTKVNPTKVDHPTYFHVTSSQSSSTAEYDAKISSVSSPQWLESQALDRVTSYLSEHSGYEHVTPSIVSALSSNFSYLLDNNLNYVTTTAEFDIQKSDYIDPSVLSPLIPSSSYLTLSHSRENNIHQDQRLIESTLSLSVTSNNVYISEATSSTEYGTTSWTDHILLQSTTQQLIELETPLTELTSPLIELETSLTELTSPLTELETSFTELTSPLMDSMTTLLIQLTKVSLTYVSSITSVRSEINPSIGNNTDDIVLTSDHIVGSRFPSDSIGISSSAAHYDFLDSNHTSMESISITKMFTEVSVTSSVVTEQEEAWQPTGVPTSPPNSSTVVTPQARHDDNAGLDDDTVWPVVAALVIGIPVIIVLGIAVTVIHRNRRQDPGKFFAMRTLNSSSQSSIATPRQDISQESSVDV